MPVLHRAGYSRRARHRVLRELVRPMRRLHQAAEASAQALSKMSLAALGVQESFERAIEQSCKLHDSYLKEGIDRVFSMEDDLGQGSSQAPEI